MNAGHCLSFAFISFCHCSKVMPLGVVVLNAGITVAGAIPCLFGLCPNKEKINDFILFVV